MPPTLTYPGVYVQEVPSGVRPIAGVSTATTLFIGASGEGPLDDPTLMLGYDEFVETFGADTSISELSRQVGLFFMNGGTTAYVMRIANGATSASVTLLTEAGDPSLLVTAASPGAHGEQIRLRVSYGGSQPDSGFDVEIFRWQYDAAGNRTAVGLETFTGLSMDPDSSRYAPTLLTSQSQLVNVDEAPGAPGATNGWSQSGLAVPWRSSANSSFRDQWADLLGSTGPAQADQTFTISVDGGDPVAVPLDGIVLSGLTVGNIRTELAAEIVQAVTDAHAAVGRPGVVVDVEFVDGPAIATVDDALHGGTNFDVTSYLRITSTTGGDIVVVADGGLFARTLRLGLDNGGREAGANAIRRPASNAAVLDEAALVTLGARTHADIADVVLDGETITIPASADPTRPFFVPQAGGYPAGRGGLDGITERLRVVRDAINSHAASTASFGWVAELWGARLAVRRTTGNDNDMLPADFATAPDDIAGDFSDDVRLYTVGIAGQDTGSQVSAGAMAIDGNPPQSTDYDAAYSIAERELDIFNLLVLPETTAPGAIDRKTLWGPASVFCQRNRAFLLMDPPATWTDHRDPLDGTGADDSLTDLRIGLVKDHAAIHYPDLTIVENAQRVSTSPSGAVAGLMARIDTARGVWKAAAGTEADIRGIVGVERAFSDAENGNLNPRGINTIRRFPTGIVNWGARTMDGDNDTGSEYKYVPVRRLLLYLEESIYRGLQWTVFEPNGLDLWAAIRLNVGNFLNGLYRQGAFAGATASEAYYVKCDAETTTPTDRALGIVNVHIGVATLKPAEFVVLYFRQITLPEE